MEIGFEEEDIQFLCEGYPELESVSYKEAFTNILIVTKAGYPVDDIEFLIAMNPTFLWEDPVLLVKKVTALGVEIEDLLKDDPSLI